MKEVEELACPFCGYARPRVKPSAAASPVCPRCGHRVGDEPLSSSPPASDPVPSELLSDLESQARELEVDKLELEEWLNEETRQADEDQSRVSMVNLREKIGRLARQHRGAGERLHLLRSEYQGLQKQLESVASNVESYTPDTAVLKRQQADLQEQIRDAEIERLTELTKQLEDKLATEHGLRMTAAQRIDVLERVQREADQARKTSEDLRHRHRKTEADLTRLKAERDRLFAECETRKQATHDLESKVQDLSTARKRLEDLRHRHRKTEVDLTRLQAERDRLFAQCETRKQATHDLESKVQDLSTARKKLGDLHHKHWKAQNDLVRLQKERDRVHVECEARKQAILDLESRVEDLSTERLEHRRHAAELNGKIADLAGRQDELLRETAEWTKEKALADRRIADLEERAQAHIASDEKLHALQHEHRILEQQLEGMTREWEARQHEFEHLRETNQALSARNQELEVDLAAATRRAREAKQRIADLEQDHDRAEFEHSVVAKLEEANRELQADRSQHEQAYRQLQEQLGAALAARHTEETALDALTQQADELTRETDTERARSSHLAGEVRRLGEQIECADRLRVQAETRVRELEGQPRVDPAVESAIQDLKSRNADLLKGRSRLEDEAARTRNRLQAQIETTERSIQQAETLDVQNGRLREDLEALQSRVKRLREIETDLRTMAESVPPLEHQIQVLERENHALNAQFQETQRSLSDAAAVVTQVTALRSELERLGRKYLRAREEVARGQTERMNLRDELSELADRVLSERREETGYSAAEVARARRLIREAILKHLQPGSVDLSQDP